MCVLQSILQPMRAVPCCDPGSTCRLNAGMTNQCQPVVSPQCKSNPVSTNTPTETTVVRSSVTPSTIQTKQPSIQPTIPQSAAPTNVPTKTSLSPPRSSGPTAVPSAQPARTFENLICQYGCCCTVDSDCTPGNKCVSYSPFYSQCVPYRAAILDRHVD